MIKKTTEKPHERDKSFSKEEKEKKGNIMVVNNTKIYQKMKNKCLMSIEKNIIKWEKTPNYNYKELFSFRKSTIISKSNDKWFLQEYKQVVKEKDV